MSHRGFWFDINSLSQTYVLYYTNPCVSRKSFYNSRLIHMYLVHFALPCIHFCTLEKNFIHFRTANEPLYEMGANTLSDMPSDIFLILNPHHRQSMRRSRWSGSCAVFLPKDLWYLIRRHLAAADTYQRSCDNTHHII